MGQLKKRPHYVKILKLGRSENGEVVIATKLGSEQSGVAEQGQSLRIISEGTFLEEEAE